MPAKQEDKIAAAILTAAILSKYPRLQVPMPMRMDGEGVDLAKLFNSALKAVSSSKTRK